MELGALVCGPRPKCGLCPVRRFCRTTDPLLRHCGVTLSRGGPCWPGFLRMWEPYRGPWGEPIKLTAKLPKGEAYLETEAPRGQMGFYIVSNGESIPWRVRAKSSSLGCSSAFQRPIRRTVSVSTTATSARPHRLA